MSGIHDEILKKTRDELERMLITEIASTDDARVGVVYMGDLQGEPDPDIARISVTLYENDPDNFISGAVTGASGSWLDEVDSIEIGAATTWRRRFTVKARALLETTREGLSDARRIASTVRSRLEYAIPRISYSGINVNGEVVSRRAMTADQVGEQLQSGGPTDSYDYFIKIRFDVLTTTSPVP